MEKLASCFFILTTLKKFLPLFLRIILYLWYKGTYYPTTLSQVNGEEYTLIGWYDSGLRAAGGKIRVLISVRKN